MDLRRGSWSRNGTRRWYNAWRKSCERSWKVSPDGADVYKTVSAREFATSKHFNSYIANI
jgi:hypothetical protein